MDKDEKVSCCGSDCHTDYTKNECAPCECKTCEPADCIALTDCFERCRKQPKPSTPINMSTRSYTDDMVLQASQKAERDARLKEIEIERLKTELSEKERQKTVEIQNLRS